MERILVRSTNWIGDAVMTTPALGSLKANFPGARLSVLAKKWVAPVFEHHPAVTEIIVLEDEGRHRGLAGLRRLAGDIRSRQFDLAVLFQNAFGAALTVRLAGVPLRLGYDTDGRGFLLNLKVRLRPEDKLVHETIYYQRLLERSGLSITKSDPVFYLSPDSEARAASRLAAEGLSGTFLLGLAPGASYGSAKQWPADRFARASEMILNETGGTALIFGSGADGETAGRVKDLLSAPSFDLTGRTDLAETAALIKRCGLFLTNDSGLMHVASGVGAPLVAVFGSTNPITTGPVSGRVRIVRREVECSPCLKRTCDRPEHPCMDLISPGEVASAGLELLEDGEGLNG